MEQYLPFIQKYLPFFLLALGPIFVLTFIVEVIYFAFKGVQMNKIFNIYDITANISLAILYQIVDISFAFFILSYCYNWFFIHGMQLFTNISITNLLALIVLQDFLYYWAHRLHHSITWMWCAHATHHSSTYMNFATAFRQSVLYPISGLWVFYIPLVMIGFRPFLVEFVISLNLAYQYFIHTQMVNKLGVLEYIFNTPSHHRVHHAYSKKYFHKNFAGMFIIWDKLFGTFVEENEPPVFGLPTPVNSFNPLVLNFYEVKRSITYAIKHRSFLSIFKSPKYDKNTNL